MNDVGQLQAGLTANPSLNQQLPQTAQMNPMGGFSRPNQYPAGLGDMG